MNRNPGVCVCVCVEGKGGVIYVLPEFTSDYMAFTRSNREKERREKEEER